MNLNEKYYIDEPITIFNFAFLLTGYCEFADLNNIFTTDDLKKALGKLPAEQLKNFQTNYEPIILNLLKDQARQNSSFPNHVHEETRPVGDNIHNATFENTYYYLIKDLLNWLTTRYSIDTKLFPKWANEYVSELDKRKLTINVEDKDKWIEIETLPKLIQLAIKAHQHFEWDNVDFSTQQGKNNFKKDATNYLNEQAKNLKIPHSDNKKQKELGISSTTLATFLMAIKPDEE